MSIYGYCRISTAKQIIDRLVRNIRAEYPTAHIVQEAYTGTSILRPEWSKLYRVLKDGDTVVFDSVSRMSRNAEEGFSLYEDLYHKGIRLIFLKEHHIDTETFQYQCDALSEISAGCPYGRDPHTMKIPLLRFWTFGRQNRTPQYHHLLEPGTTCSILVGGWKFPYRLPAQCEQSGTQP